MKLAGYQVWVRRPAGSKPGTPRRVETRARAPVPPRKPGGRRCPRGSLADLGRARVRLRLRLRLRLRVRVRLYVRVRACFRARVRVRGGCASARLPA